MLVLTAVIALNLFLFESLIIQKGYSRLCLSVSDCIETLEMSAKRMLSDRKKNKNKKRLNAIRIYSTLIIYSQCGGESY